jgi:PAS domain S-box-containing protein
MDQADSVPSSCVLPAHGPHRRQRVLLVEDADEDSLLVRRLFKRDVIDLQVAGSVAEAVESVEAQLPDLVLLDNQLPDGSARDVLTKLATLVMMPEDAQAQISLMPCPVVVLTGDSNPVVAADVVRLGAGDYLPKDDLKPTDGNLERGRRLLHHSIERAREHHRLQRRSRRMLLRAMRRRVAERQAKRARDEVYLTLQQALQAGRMGTWTWSLQEDVVNSDDRLREIYGLDQHVPGAGVQPIKLQLFYDRIHPDDLHRVQAEISQVVEGRQKDFEQEFRIVHADGSERWVVGVGRVIRENGSSQPFLAGVNYDTTDRRVAVEALRASEADKARRVAELEATFAGSPAGLALLDPSLVFTNVNQALGQIFKLESKTFVGHPADQVLPPTIWQAVEPTCRKVLETNKRHRVQVTVNERDVQQSRGYLWSCSPVRSQEGEAIGLNVVVQDVSDLQRKERQLEQQAQELELQRAELSQRNDQLEHANAEAEAANRRLAETTVRLESLLSGAPVGFGFFDVSGRMVQGNAHLTELTGLHVDDDLSVPMGDEPALARVIKPYLARVFETGRSVIGIELEMMQQKGSNGPHWFLASFFPAGGEVPPQLGRRETSFTTVGCVILDITDRKRSERMLREAKENAISARISADRARELSERANRAKSEFLAVLSHELRTPLTPVLSGTQMLSKALSRQKSKGVLDLDEDGLRDILVDTLGTIHRNVELEVRLIDDLLDLTRITRGKLQLARRPIDLNEAVRHAVDTCREEAVDKSIQLHVDLAHGPLGTLADSARIQQVIWNLLKNAVKFTPEFGEIFITTRASDPEPGESVSAVVCEVRDTGLGIDASSIRHIFDAFEQGGRGVNRTFGGLGLGLAISRYLVDAHGGSLAAKSDGPGRGSAFSMRLPGRILRQGSKPTSSKKPPAVRQVRRILLVEDHQDTSLLMSRFLKLRFKAEVVRASSVQDGREAFEINAAAGKTFDLIVSDIGLPDGTGTDFITSLPNERPPAIALSGYGTEADIARSRDAGFLHHLVKPIDLDRLETTIVSLTDGTRS